MKLEKKILLNQHFIGLLTGLCDEINVLLSIFYLDVLLLFYNLMNKIRTL